MLKTLRIFFLVCCLSITSGCVSTVVGEAVDLTIEVVKVPFKVIGAAADVVTGDDD